MIVDVDLLWLYLPSLSFSVYIFIIRVLFPVPPCKETHIQNKRTSTSSNAHQQKVYWISADTISTIKAYKNDSLS